MREIILWCLAVVLLFAFAIAVDLFDTLYEFTRAHEDWELDEFFALLMCIGVVAIVFLAVRTRQLSNEIKRREAAEQLAHDSARHDPLTGLANRRRFREALKHALATAEKSSSRCAVLFIDLDGFKPVNDTHGHGVGDEVLIDVARQIVQAAPDEATSARLGGDEFGIIVPLIAGSESVLFLAQRLSRDIGKVRQIGTIELTVGATVGVAVFPHDGRDVDQLINAADQAMYAAKPGSRGSVGRSDPSPGIAAK